MKKLIIAAAVLLLVACKVEKTGKDTYKVVAPTPQAKAAGAEVKKDLQEMGAKLKTEAGKLGDKAKSATSSDKSETTETSETTSSTDTGTTTTKTTKHHKSKS
jgi:hypothetical protein